MATIKRLQRSTWSSPFAGLQRQLTIQFPLPGGTTSITLASHCRVNKEQANPPSTPLLLFCSKSRDGAFQNSLQLRSLCCWIIKAVAGRAPWNPRLMFQEGGADGEGVAVVVPIRLVVHLYKEQRIIIDLFMDRQNRWRPIEMRRAGRLYISARIPAIVVEGFTKTSGEPTAAAATAPLSFCLSSALEALSH